MIQQSVGGLAVSVVIREPGFSPVALPSFRGPGYCLDPLHLAGRGGSGHGGPHQGCLRQDTHFLHILVSQSSATWPFMATGTLGHVVFLGESRKENVSWGALGFLIILDNCQGGCRHNKGREKINRMNGHCFWKGTQCFYMSIIFKVTLRIYNFNIWASQVAQW